MAKFSSQEIESQFNVLKMLLSYSKKYKNSLGAIKKEIKYMPLKFKKKQEYQNSIF